MNATERLQTAQRLTELITRFSPRDWSRLVVALPPTVEQDYWQWCEQDVPRGVMLTADGASCWAASAHHALVIAEDYGLTTFRIEPHCYDSAE